MCRHPLHTDPITPSSSCPLQLSALTASIVKSLEDPPRNYAEEADSFWSHIVDATPFDWIPQVIAELQALTVEEVQQAADRWVFDPNERSSVSVMLFGKPHLQELEALKTTTSTRTRTTTRSSLVVGEVAGKEGKDEDGGNSFFPSLASAIRVGSKSTLSNDDDDNNNDSYIIDNDDKESIVNIARRNRGYLCLSWSDLTAVRDSLTHFDGPVTPHASSNQ